MADITRPSLGDRIRNGVFNLILRFQARKYQNNPELILRDFKKGKIDERKLSVIDIKTIESTLQNADIESYKKIVDAIGNKLDLNSCLSKLVDEKYSYLLSKVNMTEDQFNKELNWLLENNTYKIKLLVSSPNAKYLTPDLLSKIYEKTDQVWGHLSEDIQEKPGMFDVMLSNLEKERNSWASTKLKDESKFLKLLDKHPVIAIHSFISNNSYLYHNFRSKLTYYTGKTAHDTVMIQTKTIVKNVIKAADKQLDKKDESKKKNVYVLIFNGIRPDLMDDELFVSLFKRINPNLDEKEINKQLTRFNLIKSSYPEANTTLNPDFLLIDGIPDNMLSRFSTNISLQDKLLKINSTAEGKRILSIFLKHR